MSEEIQVGSPEHEALRTEYGAALASGDQAKIDAVGARYSQMAGAKQELDLSGGGVKAGPAPTEAEADQSFFQESLAECDSECRAAWGDQYDERMGRVMEVAQELFPGPEGAQLMEKIMGELYAHGVKMADVNFLLDRIASRFEGEK